VDQRRGSEKRIREEDQRRGSEKRIREEDQRRGSEKKIREEDQRRERVGRKKLELLEKVGKSRNTVFSNDLWLWRVEK
jgi:hypothetical protein